MVSLVRAVQLVFVGDSNTRCVDPSLSTSSTGGFRYLVWQQLAPLYTVDLAGTVTDGLTFFPDEHEGWNGFGLGGTGGGPSPNLVDKIPNLTTVAADIVCLLSPVNEFAQTWVTSGTLSTLQARLASYLDAVHAARPSASVLLGSAPPITSGNYHAPATDADRLTYNAALPGIASARSGWCTFVDTAAGVTTADLSDGVHLGPNGHAKVAAAWSSALMAASGPIDDQTQTTLQDGRALLESELGAGTTRGTNGGQHRYVLERVAAELGKTVPALTVVDESAPLPAKIERGNWVVRCTTCGGTEAVWIDRQLMLCTQCWNSALGGSWRTVSIPDPATRAEIERLFGYRTVHQRWWTTESIATLQAENASLGLPT